MMRQEDEEDEEENGLAGFMETLVELQTGEDKDKPVQYQRWMKEAAAAGGRPDWEPVKLVKTVGEVAKMMETDFENLTAHLKRNMEIKHLIKEKRMWVINTEGVVMIHIDWGENHVVKVAALM